MTSSVIYYSTEAQKNEIYLFYTTIKCSTVWNDGSSTILSKLSKLQRRAARVITSQTYDVRSTQILGDLSWIPIEDTLKRREIIMSFKALTDRLPTYLQELFSKCNNDNYYLVVVIIFNQETFSYYMIFKKDLHQYNYYKQQ